MVQDIIAETVIAENIAFVILQEQSPVFPETLWAKYKNPVIPEFIILDDSQGFKSFSQANAVSDDATVVSLQFINCTKNTILLELIQFLPKKLLN